MPDILLEHKLIFMHNPKCGSRNVRSLAMQILKRYPTAYMGSLNNNLMLLIKKDKSSRMIQNVIDGENNRDLDYTFDHCNIRGVYKLFQRCQISILDFKFICVIRHPQDRLESSYRFDLKRKAIPDSISFSEYIHTSHVIPGAMPLNNYPIQRFAQNPKGKMQIDYLIKLESFQQDIKRVLQKHNLDDERFDYTAWNNASKDYDVSVKLKYTPQDLAFIRQHWAEDFRLGGYTMREG